MLAGGFSYPAGLYYPTLLSALLSLTVAVINYLAN
jgi:hypothetical protein